jgi:hypothetical protein
MLLECTTYVNIVDQIMREMWKSYKLLVEENFTTLTIYARKIFDHSTLNRNKRQFSLEKEIKERIL